jgi:hypothetical protein
MMAILHIFSIYDDDMSPHATSEAPADSSAPSAPVALSTSRGEDRSRWVARIALAIALIAVALAAWSLRASHPNPTASQVTDQQVVAAKNRACAASTTVSTAVSLQTHIDLGGDPPATQAVAANARLSMAVGSSYLLSQLGPATPPSLTEPVRSFADNLQGIAIHTMAGVGNDDPAQAVRLRDAQTASAQIVELCK